MTHSHEIHTVSALVNALLSIVIMRYQRMFLYSYVIYIFSYSTCVLIQMLSRMQSQLNRMEVKFDKLLSKSRKKRLESESPLENQRSPGFSPSPVSAHMSPEPVSPFVFTDTPGSSGIRSYQFWLLFWIRVNLVICMPVGFQPQGSGMYFSTCSLSCSYVCVV